MSEIGQKPKSRRAQTLAAAPDDLPLKSEKDVPPCEQCNEADEGSTGNYASVF